MVQRNAQIHKIKSIQNVFHPVKKDKCNEKGMLCILHAFNIVMFELKPETPGRLDITLSSRIGFLLMIIVAPRRPALGITTYKHWVLSKARRLLWMAAAKRKLRFFQLLSHPTFYTFWLPDLYT